MSKIQIDALSMALKDGVLERKLTKEQPLYMHDSVVEGNKIVQAVGAKGMYSKQIAQFTKASTTELSPLLKWLESIKDNQGSKERHSTSVQQSLKQRLPNPYATYLIGANATERQTLGIW